MVGASVGIGVIVGAITQWVSRGMMMTEAYQCWNSGMQNRQAAHGYPTSYPVRKSALLADGQMSEVHSLSLRIGPSICGRVRVTGRVG